MICCLLSINIRILNRENGDGEGETDDYEDQTKAIVAERIIHFYSY